MVPLLAPFLVRAFPEASLKRERKMISTPIRKSILVGVAGLSLTGAVAGCAPGQAATVEVASAAASADASATSIVSPSAALAQTGAYKDGAYSADGTYTSPNGQETVGVQLTLSSGSVSDASITVHASNPMSKKFQEEFAGGIKAAVVGKKLDELNVSKVSGSSLTGGGFNQALEAIKTQAK
jgi:hypothetical protein